MKITIVFSIVPFICNVAWCSTQEKFPQDFLFGASTSSYQIEGGWNADDKTENIWDYISHTKPHEIKDHSTGDISTDSYHNYKRDVEMMRELGLDAYRFSLSWTRILPSGYPDRISEAGVKFYNNYIDEMLKYNITPIATIFHWDLPQNLQLLGGFANSLIAEWFEDYARVVFQLFGNKVKHWITINEPREICYFGYGSVLQAPQLNSTAFGTYICAKNLLMAHARMYHVYNTEFKPTQRGVCGITIHTAWFSPDTDSEEDQFATEIKKQAEWGLYTEPILSKNGGFPELFHQRVAEKSKQQGFPRSRLPQLTEKEKNFIKGTSDFLGINHYSGMLVSATEHFTENAVPSFIDDQGVGAYMSDKWLSSTHAPMKLVPKSLYNILIELSKRYNYPTIYVTENGFPTAKGLEDDTRVLYYRASLQNALDAINEGVQLKGYLAWSLMDNFEWLQGYTQRFGLFEVDFEDPARTRRPRKSAFVYKQIIKTRSVDHNYEPENMLMTID